VGDAEVRALVRLAETQGDAASWERAACALAREGKRDEAGRALARAGELGADTRAAEEALEEIPWASLAPRQLHLSGATPGEIAWRRDGSRLYVVSNERTVVAVEPTEGSLSTFVWQEGRIAALAPDTEGNALLIADLVGTPSQRPTSRIRKIFPDAREPAWELVVPVAVRSLAIAPRGRALVWSSYQNRVFAHRLDARGRPDPTPCFDAFRATHSGDGELVRASGEWAEVLGPPDALVAPPAVARAPLVEPARALIESSFYTRFSTARAWLRFASNERLARPATSAFPTGGALAVSPAGRHVAVARLVEAPVQWVDLVSGVERDFALGTVSALAWSPDGRRLAASTSLGLYVIEGSREQA
jgi:hypothetical protein